MKSDQPQFVLLFIIQLIFTFKSLLIISQNPHLYFFHLFSILVSVNNNNANRICQFKSALAIFMRKLACISLPSAAQFSCALFKSEMDQENDAVWLEASS